jgi:branched-chain amino acid transport system substrate-binding protein
VRAGSDNPKAIRDALAVTKDFPAVTGVTTLNADGDAEKEVAIVKIIDGKKTFIGLIQPEI